MRVLAVCLSAILITACRHQPLAYTLVPKGPQIILNPPIPPAPELVLPRARQSQKTRLRHRWRLDHASLDRKNSPASAWLPPMAIPADRTACLPTRSRASKPFVRIFSPMWTKAASPPLNVRASSSPLRNDSPCRQTPPTISVSDAFAQTGFVELTPDFRLKVVSPLPSDGVEVAFYSITAAPKDDRMRIAVDSFTTNPAGASPIAPLTSPGHDRIGFRALFWTTARSSVEPPTPPILVAENRPALDAATQAFQAQPDGSCRTSLGAGVTCVPVPLQWAVNAELRVRVNGSDAYVTIGGTVSQVAANQSHVTVMRMFNGRLIPVKGENLMRLVLMPGDQITYP